jgi:tRNA (guanine-N7-)-methyltransferase
MPSLVWRSAVSSRPFFWRVAGGWAGLPVADTARNKGRYMSRREGMRHSAFPCSRSYEPTHVIAKAMILLLILVLLIPSDQSVISSPWRPVVAPSSLLKIWRAAVPYHQSNQYHGESYRLRRSPRVTSVLRSMIPLKTTETPLSQKWYKAKQAHVTKHQKEILRDHWDTYGIVLKWNQTIDLPDLSSTRRVEGAVGLAPTNSSRARTVLLDIGFGTGDSIIHAACNNPDNDNQSMLVIGCELTRSGISQTIEKALACNVTSDKLRIIRADVTQLIRNHIQNSSLDIIQVFFPDPWPHEFRDGSRRVIRNEMVQLFYHKLRPGGVVRVATDVSDYAAHCQRVFASEDGKGFVLRQYAEHDACSCTPMYRCVTKYERRAADLGHRVFDFEYQRAD